MPKTHMFAPGERRNVEIWVVAGYHRNLLFTDDSFQFARAMRQVQFVLQTGNAGRQTASEGRWAGSELPFLYFTLACRSTRISPRV